MQRLPTDHPFPTDHPSRALPGAAIGAALNAARIAHGLTYRALSARAHLEALVVWRVLAGRSSRPGFALVAAIAGALGLNLQKLVETVLHQEKNDEDEH